MTCYKLSILLTSILLLADCEPVKKENKPVSFTEQDVLDDLERGDQQDYHFFIDLEHPYFFTAGSRLTLYADKKRWAIVFEKTGYDTGNSSGEIELCYFGNCLTNLLDLVSSGPKTSNMKSVILVKEDDLEKIADGFELVGRDQQWINVRDTVLPVEQDTMKYRSKGISAEPYDNPKDLIDFPSLIRYLDEGYPSVFRATDKELRECIPADLPRLMQIDHWHHEAYANLPLIKSFGSKPEYTPTGAPPGGYETYRMIASVLASRDTTRWRPTLKPNNDWRNWPRAGSM